MSKAGGPGSKVSDDEGGFESMSDPLEDSMHFQEEEWLEAAPKPKPGGAEKVIPKLDDFKDVEEPILVEITKEWERFRQ